MRSKLRQLLRRMLKLRKTPLTLSLLRLVRLTVDAYSSTILHGSVRMQITSAFVQIPVVHQRSGKLLKLLPFDAIAEEEEEEIKGNVKADQSSVADSTASGNKVILLSC